MGGFGSGTWYRWNKKTTVEDCLTLNVSDLSRPLDRSKKIISGSAGNLNWHIQSGIKVGQANFQVLTSDDNNSWVLLKYTVPNGTKTELPIRLQTTQPHFGGTRWWFTCPLLQFGTACNRRVAKLHLRGLYFGCRHCHNLTYRSSQDSRHPGSGRAMLDKVAERMGVA